MGDWYDPERSRPFAVLHFNSTMCTHPYPVVTSTISSYTNSLPTIATRQYQVTSPTMAADCSCMRRASESYETVPRNSAPALRYVDFLALLETKTATTTPVFFQVHGGSISVSHESHAVMSNIVILASGTHDQNQKHQYCLKQIITPCCCCFSSQLHPRTHTPRSSSIF